MRRTGRDGYVSTLAREDIAGSAAAPALKARNFLRPIAIDPIVMTFLPGAMFFFI
jgi:hypothetical protein